MHERKTYLGDSVYVSIEDKYYVCLTTENSPNKASNIIYLEPLVMTNFERWLTELKDYYGSKTR